MRGPPTATLQNRVALFHRAVLATGGWPASLTPSHCCATGCRSQHAPSHPVLTIESVSRHWQMSLGEKSMLYRSHTELRHRMVTPPGCRSPWCLPCPTWPPQRVTDTQHPHPQGPEGRAKGGLGLSSSASPTHFTLKSDSDRHTEQGPQAGATWAGKGRLWWGKRHPLPLEIQKDTGSRTQLRNKPILIENVHRDLGETRPHTRPGQGTWSAWRGQAGWAGAQKQGQGCCPELQGPGRGAG